MNDNQQGQGNDKSQSAIRGNDLGEDRGSEQGPQGPWVQQRSGQGLDSSSTSDQSDPAGRDPSLQQGSDHTNRGSGERSR
jgi:hypothetical protein